MRRSLKSKVQSPKSKENPSPSPLPIRWGEGALTVRGEIQGLESKGCCSASFGQGVATEICKHVGSSRRYLLRPASLYSDDYALMEYGLTQKELDKSFKKVSAEIEREAKAGRLKKFV